MKVAILGGGGVGCAAALEIASAGHTVHIFESRDDILLGASRANEGKIHKGFIYAKDDPELTARTMARGALDFQDLLSRWIDVESAITTSTPFIYALHRDSQVDAEHLKAHFARCCEIFNEIRRVTGQSYLGFKAPAAFWELPQEDVHDLLDDEIFSAAFQTTEFAVDPGQVANALAQSVRGAPRIEVRCQTVVSAVTADSHSRFFVCHSSDSRDGPYDHVVNATWEGRLKIDAAMGIDPPPSYSIRHKYGHRVAIALDADQLPSVTIVLGPFGDIVNFGSNGFFLSWYPQGMTSMIKNAAPDTEWHRIDRTERLGNYRKSSEHWQRLCPRVSQLSYPEEAIDPTSGMIYALGDTDIDHTDSVLHTRHDVGIQSVGGYHTVNTGKFTLFPQMAKGVASRVLGTA